MFYSVVLPRKREKVVKVEWSEMFPKLESVEMMQEEKKSLKRLTGVSTSLLTITPLTNVNTTEEINQNIIHAFDPLISVIQGVSHPVAFLMIAGGCICLMMGQKHKGMNIIKWAAVGYILIQFIPGIMQILEHVGRAINHQA